MAGRDTESDGGGYDVTADGQSSSVQRKRLSEGSEAGRKHKKLRLAQAALIAAMKSPLLVTSGLSDVRSGQLLLEESIQCHAAVSAKACKRGEPRTISSGWFIQKLEYSETGFWDSFRMTKDSFYDLLDCVRETNEWERITRRRNCAIDDREILAVVLYILFHGSTYREIEDQFGICNAYVSRLLPTVLSAIVEGIVGLFCSVQLIHLRILSNRAVRNGRGRREDASHCRRA